ncbi:hypothetical protein HDU93_003105 [Gonapodya sp. JEL0774]|nr:hypothetical protein HDU93_003105 [Gonapodya sp. JEL0774]
MPQPAPPPLVSGTGARTGPTQTLPGAYAQQSQQMQTSQGMHAQQLSLQVANSGGVGQNTPPSSQSPVQFSQPSNSPVMTASSPPTPAQLLSPGTTPRRDQQSPAPSSASPASPPTSSPAGTSTPSASSSKDSKICSSCNLPIRGQFVRALDGVYHLDCFKCRDCGQIVAQKFFASKGEDGKPFPLCETTYNIKLGTKETAAQSASLSEAEAKRQQMETEDRISRIQTVLTAFEDSAAECIQPMLLQISVNHAYADGVRQAARFIQHVEALFAGIDSIETSLRIHGDRTGLQHNKEPRKLAKKVVEFFNMLSQTDRPSAVVPGVVPSGSAAGLIPGTAGAGAMLTPGSVGGGLPSGNGMGGAGQRDERTNTFLQLVTDLAVLLKHLIKAALQGALKLERSYNEKESLNRFLNRLMETISPSNPPATPLYPASQSASQAQLSGDSAAELSARGQGSRQAGSSSSSATATKPIASSFSDPLLTLITPELDGRTSSQDSANMYPNARLVGMRYQRQREHLPSTTLWRANRTAENAPAAPAQEQPRWRPAFLSTYRNSNMLPPTGGADPSHKGYEDDSNADLSDQDPSQAYGYSRPPNNLDSDSDEDNKYAPSGHSQPPSTSSSATRTNEQATWRPEGSKVPTQYPVPMRRPHQEIVSEGQRYISELSPLESTAIQQSVSQYLQEAIGGYMSAEEMADFTMKKPTVGEKIVSWLKGGGGQNNKKGGRVKDATFGVHLEVLVDRHGEPAEMKAGYGRVIVPKVILACLRNMRKQDLRAEGIFRKNGNIKRLKEVSETLDQNPELISCLDTENVIQLAALLKKFLRDMPEPLLTFRLHKVFTLSQKFDDPSVQFKIIHYAICLLPKPNRDLLEVLFLFLRDVADKAVGDGGNKMDVDNLATVMAPNILYSKSRDPIKDESFYAVQVVRIILDRQDELWALPEELNRKISEGNALEGGSQARDGTIVGGSIMANHIVQYVPQSSTPAPYGATAPGLSTSPYDNQLRARGMPVEVGGGNGIGRGVADYNSVKVER